MGAAPKPINEVERLRALSEYRILGTKPEESYDNITSMAAMICHAPIALISLVQTVRQSGARKVYVTHGQSDVLARYLREVEGIEAEPLETLFEGEAD